MDGNASETQIAAFLIALRTKGETVDELAGPGRDDARARRRPCDCDRDDLLDTAGTGGGRHDVQRLDDRGADRRRRRLRGGQARQPLAPPRCRGSADVLEALGARIDLEPDGGRALHRARSGFGFMFAPAHHQATRFVVPVRKELAVRTIFNFLGPLTNPAGATAPGDRRLRRRRSSTSSRERWRASASTARW